MAQHRDDLESDSPNWGLVRPSQPPLHNRFFEEGEEPPARYDLGERVDYIRPRKGKLETDRWRLIAKRQDQNVLKNAFIAFGYYVLALGGVCVFVPFQLLLAPFLHAEMTLHALRHLTEDTERYWSALITKRWFQITVANLPVQLSRVSIPCGLFFLGQTIWPLPKLSHLEVAVAFIGVAVIGVTHLWIAVRVTGFVTHLVLQHDLGPLDAIRANWRITYGRTRFFMREKLKMWLMKYPIGLVTFGLGFLVIEPRQVAIWTAAYLDLTDFPFEDVAITSPDSAS